MAHRFQHIDRNTLKIECLHGKDFPTQQQAAWAIFDDIETFYNPRRLRRALGYRSPVEFELEFSPAKP